MRGRRGLCTLLAALTLLLAAAPALCAADSEELAVVVSADVDRGFVDARQLAAIYRRKRRFWADGSPIEPVNLEAADPRRLHFSRVVLGLLPEAMEAYWDEQYFHGVLPPRVLASPEAVLRFLVVTPGAVGYVPLCQADRRVSIVAVINSAVTAADSGTLAACHR